MLGLGRLRHRTGGGDHHDAGRGAAGELDETAEQGRSRGPADDQQAARHIMRLIGTKPEHPANDRSRPTTPAAVATPAYGGPSSPGSRCGGTRRPPAYGLATLVEQ